MTKHWKKSSLTLATCLASVAISTASATSSLTGTKSDVPATSPVEREDSGADATESRFEAAFLAHPADFSPSRPPADPLVSAPTTGALLGPSPASSSTRSADEEPTIPHHPALSDRFYIGLGAFYSTSSTQAQLNSASGIGTDLDLEKVLGLEETKVSPQGLARYRISDRWRIELEYFQLNRSSTRTIGQDINWGDQTFPVGTSVDTDFNVAVTRLSFGYSFFKRPDKEIGIALGFHITDISMKLEGQGGNSDKGDVLAPLPVLSMYGQFALTDEWAIAGRLDAFKMEYDPYRGHIYSLGVDVLYQPFRHFGFGLGWRSLEFEVEAEQHNWNGRANSSYSGPIAFIAASF